MAISCREGFRTNVMEKARMAPSPNQANKRIAITFTNCQDACDASMIRMVLLSENPAFWAESERISTVIVGSCMPASESRE